MVMKLCGLPITSGLVQGPRGTRLETVAVVTLRHSTNSPLMTEADISLTLTGPTPRSVRYIPELTVSSEV